MHVCCRAAVAVGIDKLRPPNQTGKENKSQFYRNVLGIKAEQIQSSNDWNTEEEQVTPW